MKFQNKTFLLSILIIVNFNALNSQHNWIIPLQQEINFKSVNSDLVYFQNIKSLKWGVMNKEGQSVIPAEYEDVRTYDTNLFRVKKDGHYYLIERNQNIVFGRGEKLTHLEIDGVLSSGKNDKVFRVGKQNKFGIKAISGKYLVEPKYQSLIPISDQLIKIYNHGKYGLLNIEGDTLCLPVYNGIRLVTEGIYTKNENNIYEMNGKALLPDDYIGFEWVDSNNIITQKKIDHEQGIRAKGIIDLNNEVKLGFHYKQIYHHDIKGESFYTVMKGGKYGLMDKNYQLIIPHDYETFGMFDDETFYFKKDGSRGIITSTNKIIFQGDYEGINSTGENYLAKKEGSYTFIDSSGNTIKQLNASYIRSNSSDLIYAVKKNGKYGYINVNGEFVLKPSYDSAEGFINGYGKVSKNKKYGLVDMTGHEIVNCKYDDLYIGENGLITVREKYKVGLIQLPTTNEE